MEKTIIENSVRGDERAFYGERDTVYMNCRIEGEEDGESAFKECRYVSLCGCKMALRYPLWHVRYGALHDCVLEESCRAPLWYSENIFIRNTAFKGVKALRECRRVEMEASNVFSAEFGWKTRGFTASNSCIEGEYLFLDSSDISLDSVKIKGKYSFQYVKNAVIKNCVLDTKDAFWHSENVTVYDSVVSGEYLGWYSQDLKLVRCRISGTQPLCYARGLTLVECTMEDCDLSFEKSEVNATVIGGIDSVKNPECGRITASSVGEVISEGGREKKTELTVDGSGTVLI